MIFTYEYNDTRFEIRIERLANGYYSAEIGGHHYTFSAEALRDGVWYVGFEGNRILAYVSTVKELRYVHADGRQYMLNMPENRIRDRRHSYGTGGLTAEMPGQVVDVFVNVGEEVQQGKTLVILEAMKMEIRINAPADGIVESVLVTKGDLVERGQLLIKM